MMTAFDFVLEHGLFAVIRLNNLDVALPLAEALADGGVRGIEFTLTNRDARYASWSAPKPVWPSAPSSPWGRS